MNSSYSVGINAIAIGGTNNTYININNSIAIGENSNQEYSIALGSGVSTSSSYDIQIGQVTSKGNVIIADIDIRELKKN